MQMQSPWVNYANCTKLLKSISTVRKHGAGFRNCKMNYANGGCLIAKVEINYAKGREYRKTRDHTWQIPDKTVICLTQITRTLLAHMAPL